jgi:electron transfer flavoprotein beta subunit
MIKIGVTVKRVIDPYVKIRMRSDGTGVETRHVKHTINPFDAIALEAALRLRDANHALEVVVLTVGDHDSEETLRHALALGADRAILVQTSEAHCSLNIAKIIQKVVEDESIQLVLMGKQSTDGDNNQTPQMLAGRLNWPQATFASDLTMLSPCQIRVTREIDSGLETVEMPLPAVVSVDLRMNEPRYATLPNIMRAKHKPLTTIELTDLDLVLREHVQILSVRKPLLHRQVLKLDSVQALVQQLQRDM